MGDRSGGTPSFAFPGRSPAAGPQRRARPEWEESTLKPCCSGRCQAVARSTPHTTIPDCYLSAGYFIDKSGSRPAYASHGRLLYGALPAARDGLNVLDDWTQARTVSFCGWSAAACSPQHTWPWRLADGTTSRPRMYTKIRQHLP